MSNRRDLGLARSGDLGEPFKLSDAQIQILENAGDVIILDTTRERLDDALDWYRLDRGFQENASTYKEQRQSLKEVTDALNVIENFFVNKTDHKIFKPRAYIEGLLNFASEITENDQDGSFISNVDTHRLKTDLSSLTLAIENKLIFLNQKIENDNGGPEEDVALKQLLFAITKIYKEASNKDSVPERFYTTSCQFLDNPPNLPEGVGSITKFVKRLLEKR